MPWLLSCHRSSNSCAYLFMLDSKKNVSKSHASIKRKGELIRNIRKAQNAKLLTQLHQHTRHSYTSTPTFKAEPHAPNIQATAMSFAIAEGNLLPSHVISLVFVYPKKFTCHLEFHAAASAGYCGCITWQFSGPNFRFEFALATCN